MPAATNTDRISPREAAALLEWHYETVRQAVKRGTLNAVRPHGRGIGKRFYLSRREVLALKARLRSEQ